MRSIRFAAALALSLLPNHLAACEIAIRDAKAAISAIGLVFEPYKERCLYENEGLQCLVKERSLATHSFAMPGYVPGYLAVLSASASEKTDKDVLAGIFISHLVDRSPNKDIRPRLVRAFELGEEIKISGGDCSLQARTKDGMVEVFMAGPMVR
ncbi:hypothetical protein B6S44_07265 [Bosea sp. Tri-44]|uniref:hypothetical protein n=1 Tax=Bosea sp. Tri-44 TaxID=1972137 RepID=UPI00100E7B3D|nr:hypothetical protein [Bosea sp. Tri-44]RXT55886.1 hypothetical protein B6S44_07265 [Bosea sp. Tri-44]